MEDDIIISQSERFKDIYIRQYNRVNVPAVIFSENKRRVAYINALAAKFWNGENTASIKASKNYVVFIPQKIGKTSKINKVGGGFFINIGSLGGIVPHGTKYRAYPYKGGIAIKRNEPLSERKEEKNELQENEGTA